MEGVFQVQGHLSIPAEGNGADILAYIRGEVQALGSGMRTEQTVVTDCQMAITPQGTSYGDPPSQEHSFDDEQR